MGGGMTPPFFGSKIRNLLVFSILSRKSVSGSQLHGVCMGRSGTSALQFMHFSAIFRMLAVLATSVTLWYPL